MTVVPGVAKNMKRKGNHSEHSFERDFLFLRLFKPKPAMTTTKDLYKWGLSLAMFLLLTAISTGASAQCEEGEGELTMTIQTDNWGYETYWELRPEGADCGVDVIAFGGNLDQVGCDGGGEQDATGGNGYDNNITVEVDPVCVTIGDPLTLQFVDDWGDGGLTFALFLDGVFIGSYTGQGDGISWTFTPGESDLPVYDMPCNALPIEIDGDAVMMNNTTASVFPGEVTPGGGSCALYGIWCEGGLSNTVWASFEAPEDGAVFLSTCVAGTNFDTQLAIWSATDCTDFTTFEIVSSNDDIIGGCGIANGFASGCYVSCLNPGETYYVQIDGWNAATGDVFVEATTYEGETSLEAFVNNIPCALDKGEEGNGFINLYVIGSGADFDAEWTGPNGFTSNETGVADLSPGDYSVVVTDNCGNVFEDSWTIFSPDPISISVDLTQPTCPLSTDGVVVVDPSGGTDPFEFDWSGPDDYTNTIANPEDLTEGAYVLTITDDNGCEYVQNFNLVADNLVEMDLGDDQILCLDETLLLTGPVGYSYEWQDGSVNQFFQVDANELGEGEYTFILSVENEEGCNATEAIIITVDNCLNVQNQNELEFEVYPNPSTDFITINEMPQGEKTIELFNAAGKRVHIEQLIDKQTRLNVSKFARGNYLVRITSNGVDTAHKMITLN